MEEKLESYRLRKRRTQKFQYLKEKIFKMVSINVSSSDKKVEETNVNIENTDDDVDNESIASTTTTIDENAENSSNNRSWLTYCTWLIYFLIWITLYAIAIELSVGSVYFMFSMLLGICLNTRVKPKGKKEISAYSVFNENCESIDGTFKAEMFEKQLGLRQL
ncbi:SAYSvFN domain-containing protein 1 [Chironomus tepperi]|uniref:SAYSvFN domain-containing protein 1 n=1 Tax=Chironomus tepperi TaxID=113505 RepID=UPI00391F9090